jgi:hypothetical protein
VTIKQVLEGDTAAIDVKGEVKEMQSVYVLAKSDIIRPPGLVKNATLSTLRGW